MERRENGLHVSQADANLIYTAAQAISAGAWHTVPGLLIFNQVVKSITSVNTGRK